MRDRHSAMYQNKKKNKNKVKNDKREKGQWERGKREREERTFFFLFFDSL